MGAVEVEVGEEAVREGGWTATCGAAPSSDEKAGGMPSTLSICTDAVHASPTSCSVTRGKGRSVSIYMEGKEHLEGREGQNHLQVAQLTVVADHQEVDRVPPRVRRRVPHVEAEVVPRRELEEGRRELEEAHLMTRGRGGGRGGGSGSAAAEAGVYGGRHVRGER